MSASPTPSSSSGSSAKRSSTSGGSGSYTPTLYDSITDVSSPTKRRTESPDQSSQIPSPFSLLDRTLFDKQHAINLAARQCSVVPGQVLDLLPCTPLQEALIASTVAQGGKYITRFSYKLRKDVNLAWLRQAWQRVAEKNPILLTRLVSLRAQDGREMLLQIVVDDALSWVDATTEKVTEFKVGLGSPLVRLVAANNELTWHIHHALYDSWSLALLLDEVEHEYHARPGRALYAHSLFIQHLLMHTNTGEQSTFWREHFSDVQLQHFPPPTDSSNFATPDQEISFTVSNLAWDLSEFTSASIVTAAWAVVVASETEASDVVFGSTVSGRHTALNGIEVVAGPTIATLPRRVTLDWNSTCHQMIAGIQDQTVETIPYEQTGLQQISRASEAAAAACRFQTLVVLQPRREDSTSVEFDDLVMTEIMDSETSATSDAYAIVVECQLNRDALSVRFAFDTRSIRRDHMEFVADNFRTAVEFLASEHNHGKRLATLKTAPWHHHQAWQWNVSVPDEIPACVHHIIMQRAAERPTAPAIHAWDGKFSYEELDHHSTCLAQHLGRYRIRGNIVPMVLEKSKWTPIAVLGVVKAGGVCLVLDVQQPHARLQTILSQAGPTLLLCSQKQATMCKTLGEYVNVVVAEGENCVTMKSCEPLPSVSPSDSLYINFTSGSTGLPKGAITSHANFMSSVRYQQEFLGFTTSTRVFDFSSYAFDAAWANILHSFTSGACLCIPSQDERDNDVSACLERYKITSVDFTPSVARIIDEGVRHRLKTLILGGEAVSVSDAYLGGPDTRVINVYGPAECTITVTAAELTPNRVSIGTGKGVCTWVIDVDTQDLSRIGDVGELWVEGPLVGQGYLNDEVKTNAVFVRDPKWLTRGLPASEHRAAVSGRQGRCYRTGDLVRYQSDGSLEFVGRKDNQVKIRGQRVELGEIEQNILGVLAPGPAATILAELIHPEGSKAAILVAFITLTQDNAKLVELSEREHDQEAEMRLEGITARLSAQVPSYQVPELFLPLHRVPRTSTDKMDRKALQQLGLQAYNVKSKHTVAPIGADLSTMNDKETVLQEVWASVLNVAPEQITADIPFTRLGGDSITAMQVVSQARTRNVRLTVADLLEAATIRRLAPRCKSVTQESSSALSTSEDESEPFDLSPIQNMFFDEHPQGLNHWNQSFLLELSRPVTKDLFRAALMALVQRHGMLRCRYSFDADKKRWNQRIEPESLAESLFTFAEHKVTRDEVLTISDARQTSFDLKAGPVFACDLFCLPDQSQMVLFSAHHAIIDLVSWRIVWGDVEDFITNGALNSHSTASFRQWCQRQQTIAKHLSPADVLPYKVSTPVEFWSLPQSENTFSDCKTCSEVFGGTMTAALFGQANDPLRTEPIDIIAASLALSFARVFPQRDPAAIWMEGHGRETSDALCLDITNTVGWFTTLCPLEVPVTKNSSVIEAITFAKDSRKIIPHKGQPYFMCRYHSVSGKEAFRDHGIPEITLNFSGRFQQLESEEGLFRRPHGDDMGDLMEISSSATRFTMIEVNAEVDQGQLVVTFGFHNKMSHQNELQTWTREFGITLEDATALLLETPRTFTRTDLPLLQLSQLELDHLHSQLSQADVRPDHIEDIYPCLPAQEGILISAQKGTASYLTSSVWRCVHPTQRVDSLRLQEAWQMIVKRHTILQTIFQDHPDGDGFFQIVLTHFAPRVRNITTGLTDPTTVLNGLDQPTFTQSEPGHDFVVCSSSTSGDVACRLDIHHSLMDASSLNKLLEELGHIYEGNALSSPSPFREAVQHFTSISRSQRLETWSRMLRDAQPCEFPIHEAKTVDSSEFRFGSIAVPQAACNGVGEFCVAHDITRFVFIQTIWALVLRYFTGQDKVTFGYVTHGRDIVVEGVDIENMVGPLLNLIIGTVNLTNSATQVLRGTSDSVLEKRRVQQTSLAEIYHHMGFNKSLFNSTVSVRGNRPQTSQNGLSFESSAGDDPHEFDIGVNVILGVDDMEAVVEFREPFVTQHDAQGVADVFSAAMQFLVRHALDLSNAESSLGESFMTHVLGDNESQVKEFWTKYLDGTEAAHYPVVATKTLIERNDTINIAIPSVEDRRGLLNLCQTAWALFATQMTGAEEAIVGVTVASTHVPLRMVVDYGENICDFLGRVSQTNEGVTTYGRLGRQRIASLSASASQACSFAVAIQSTDDSASRLTKSDIPLLVEVRSEPARVSFSFARDVFSREEVQDMASKFEHILNQLPGGVRSNTPIAELDLTSTSDLDTIWKWNETVPPGSPVCVHTLFGQQATATPDALAIDAWDGQLTYRQLDELSTSLAYKLMQRGVGPGSYVPLFFDKSMWMPVASLAVLKSGAAAMATDAASQPEGRLEAMTEQVQANLCISSVVREDLAKSICKHNVLVVGSEHESLDPQTLSQRLPEINPQSTLYVQFTSGSTGVPKGVLVSHQNMSSALTYQRDALNFRQDSRVLDFSSYAFDVYWSNLLHTLTIGACFCIPSAEERMEQMSTLISKYKITLADFTPSVARHMPGLHELESMTLGGETVLPSDRLLVSAKASVRNAYGPAECSPTACILQLSDEKSKGIGKGLGVCTWVVSPQTPNTLAPIGAIGELLLEGPLVGQGYLKDEATTTQAFIQDPAFLTRGERKGTLYRTGDLVSYTPTGSLLFHGRKDAQVKLRGQRIELEEIESASCALLNRECPSIDCAVEVITPSTGGAQILVLFASVPPSAQSASLATLARTLPAELARRLPPYMIPTTAHQIPKIPRLPSGKVHRAALRALGSEVPATQLHNLDASSCSSVRSRPPETETEIALAKLWAALLNVGYEGIKTGDNFFRLGADSIVAMKAVAVGKKEKVLEGLKIKDVFRKPVLEDLAASLEGRMKS